MEFKVDDKIFGLTNKPVFDVELIHIGDPVHIRALGSVEALPYNLDTNALIKEVNQVELTLIYVKTNGELTVIPVPVDLVSGGKATLTFYLQEENK